MTNPIVLLTGTAGFIGSHLSQRFLSKDFVVFGVDSLLTGNLDNLKRLGIFEHARFTFIEADVCNPVALYLPENVVPDLVLHFASPASPPRYQEHPVATYLVNSIATHHLLSYLHSHNPNGRLLFASTSEVYGDPLLHPQSETYYGNVNPNGPRSCYDESKRLGETICGVFNRTFGLDSRIVRIFNTYGPNMDPRDGRILPNFINQALQGEAMTIYGDGGQTRSYCYVDDLVDGIFRYATAEGLAGETINLGNADEKTVLETAQSVAAALGIAFEPTFKPLPADDPTRRRPDLSKAERLLSWKPSTSFSEGLAKTIAYFQTIA